jgi:glucokinase
VAAGALAEGAFGAARTVRDYAFVPVGTGIAAALVLDGRPWQGAHGLAGELGHVQVDPAGAPCGCGKLGCLETVASATAIARRYSARIGGGSGLDAAAVWTRRAQGDVVADTVWAEAIDAMGRVLADTQTTVDVELIVLGGGLARAGEELRDMLDRAVASRLVFESRPRLVLAGLGDQAGCIGAAMLALR